VLFRSIQIRHTDTLKKIKKQINADFELRLQSTVSELKVKTPQLDIFNKKPDMTQYLNKEIAQWNLTAIQTMRQLSHEFAISNSTKSLRWVENPRRIFWRILAIIDSFSTSIKSAPTSPYLFTAMVGSLIAYPVLRGQSFQGGIIRFFTVFFPIFLVQSTIFTTRKRLRPGWWFLDILGLAFIMILPWIIPFFSVIDNTKQAHNNKRIIFDITIVLIFMAIHIAQSYVISGEEIIRVLNRQNSENLIREKLTSEQVAILSRNWAEHVHGRLVTRLTSASILLGREGPKGDSESTIAALDIISDALHDENSNLTEVEVERNLAEEISFRVEPWSGIVDIHMNIESKCKSKKSSRLSEIGVLVEEAISNSVRHGDSTAINLSIAMANRTELVIRVVDDSKVPVPAGISEIESRSLGLLIYDSVSDGNWTLVHDSQKMATTFQARIALV
jgi:two-component sensor histidine kinase